MCDFKTDKPRVVKPFDLTFEVFSKNISNKIAALLSSEYEVKIV